MGNTVMRAAGRKTISRFFVTFFVALIMWVNVCAAQAPDAINPYKPLVDRLESIVSLPLDEWRYHTDVAHPEDSSLDDKEWPVVKTGEAWKTGPRVLRRRIEVPATLNGYSLRGARIRLDLAVDSNDSVMITVFSNGGMVSRTDADQLKPIVAAFPEGRAEHEAILDAAAKSVDLSALDHGDQAALDESLRKAQSKL